MDAPPLLMSNYFILCQISVFSKHAYLLTSDVYKAFLRYIHNYI